MITLYEILEVSEKAYKVLAKRYHPDLQETANKEKAEIKMKEINEAYEILSDDTKRKAYDETLARKREEEKAKVIAKEKQWQAENIYANTQYRNVTSQNRPIYTQTNQQNVNDAIRRKQYEEELRQQQNAMRKNMQQAYENAYYDYLRSLGFKIKEGWTWEKTKALLMTIVIIVGIVMLLWVIPPTHDMLVNFYETNILIKIIVDIILGIVNAIIELITGAFKKT